MKAQMPAPEVLLLAATLLLAAEPLQAAEARPSLAFNCRPDNDLYRALAASEGAFPRFDAAAEAVARAPSGAGVLILADGYPGKTTTLDAALLDAAAGKKLRLYVEYPRSLPGIEAGQPRGTRWERAVVASGIFGPALKKLRILAIHDCRFVPMAAREPHIVLARVAGFDTAVFGLPKQTFPILFEHPRGDILVAATKLSQFVTARYSPAEAWRTIWQAILEWLCPGRPVAGPKWTPTVRPAYGPSDELPPDAEQQAFRRGVEWFKRPGLLVAPPTNPPAQPLRGDGTHGLFEGFSSIIRCDGSQPVRRALRNDCIGESAMAFAFGGAVLRDAQSSRIARNLNDYIYFHSVFAQGPRADRESPSFGLLSWASSAAGTYYGDDNARSMLGTMASAALLRSDRWDELLLRCLLANLRTSGRYGFRGNALNEGTLQRNGWRRHFAAFTVNYAPHYEAYLWACYLWAYRHTGCKLFLHRARTAIRMTMAAYPRQWRWTNGMQQERARMLLPLAWLVRIDDTPEHRGWLRRMAVDLLALEDRSGALREELGPPGHGTIPPPSSNEAYGRGEAPLVQQNGDPACDLLYTGAFAFLGLHEAAAATGGRLYADAEERLARFLCRIQVCSEAHPELDGAWFRAFDFRRWEPWGSNADVGWGAWCIETGWKQAWIVSVLGLRQMKTSLWELTAESRIGRHFARLHGLMLPAGEEIPAATRIEHLALGRAAKLAHPYDPRYTGGGDGALTDGAKALPDHRDPAWQGFWQHDLDATIDLGRPTAIKALSSEYLQSTGVGIFLPTTVEYAVSDDGGHFRVVATVANDVPVRREGPLTRRFAADIAQTTARHVRVRARSIRTIPDWHPARGRKAWLFVDEIAVK